MGNADDHLIGFAELQEALTEQAVVAAEVGELHAHRVTLLEQFMQAHGPHVPAFPHCVVGMQRRVVAQDR